MRIVTTGWLFSILLFLLCWDLKADNAHLKLEINLSKEKYFVSEPIWLDITLTNIGQDTVRTFGLCIPCGDTKLMLLNENGDTLPYRGIQADMARGSGYVMQPGEHKYECDNLIAYFGERVDFFRLELKPGKYSLSAAYYGSKSAIINCEEIDFEITKPSGIETEALELLKKGYRAQITNEPNIAKNCFEEIVTRFPKSVYSEIAHKELASSDSLKMEMLSKFPDTGYS
ncbi:MAG: hypothetical protein ACFFDI_26070, partial [Promethearchaeota archaeon]